MKSWALCLMAEMGGGERPQGTQDIVPLLLSSVVEAVKLHEVAGVAEGRAVRLVVHHLLERWGKDIRNGELRAHLVRLGFGPCTGKEDSEALDLALALHEWLELCSGLDDDQLHPILGLSQRQAAIMQGSSLTAARLYFQPDQSGRALGLQTAKDLITKASYLAAPVLCAIWHHLFDLRSGAWERVLEEGMDYGQLTVSLDVYQRFLNPPTGGSQSRKGQIKTLVKGLYLRRHGTPATTRDDDDNAPDTNNAHSRGGCACVRACVQRVRELVCAGVRERESARACACVFTQCVCVCFLPPPWCASVCVCGCTLCVCVFVISAPPFVCDVCGSRRVCLCDPPPVCAAQEGTMHTPFRRCPAPPSRQA